MERIEALCQGENWTLSGTDMFTMVSTYGFPPDLIREYVKSRQGQIDEDAYQKSI